jgi:SAM-dependent methyltransferase
LKEYIDQLNGKTIAILIPGCGNAYEAEYLLTQGFTNITVIDIAPLLTAALEKKFRKEVGKTINIITGDFFEHEGKYDLILEQTFLSALDPLIRPTYIEKMHSLLKPRGRLVGVLFSQVFEDGPPFGGTLQEYKLLFSKKFKIKTLELCSNSIERRRGSEVFINMIAR